MIKSNTDYLFLPYSYYWVKQPNSITSFEQFKVEMRHLLNALSQNLIQYQSIFASLKSDYFNKKFGFVWNRLNPKSQIRFKGFNRLLKHFAGFVGDKHQLTW